MKEGYVHLYTGDGKGKTTAAAGLAARAAGQGLKVAFIQFLKSGISGEVLALNKLGAQVLAPQTKKFIWEMSADEKAECAKKQQETLERAKEMMRDFDLVVLDEIACVLAEGMIEKQQMENFLNQRPPETELVLTGRAAPAWLADYCGYVTEMKMHKHPYQQGTKARKGVEF